MVNNEVIHRVESLDDIIDKVAPGTIRILSHLNNHRSTISLFGGERVDIEFVATSVIETYWHIYSSHENTAIKWIIYYPDYRFLTQSIIVGDDIGLKKSREWLLVLDGHDNIAINSLYPIVYGTHDHHARDIKYVGVDNIPHVYRLDTKKFIYNDSTKSWSYNCIVDKPVLAKEVYLDQYIKCYPPTLIDYLGDTHVVSDDANIICSSMLDVDICQRANMKNITLSCNNASTVQFLQYAKGSDYNKIVVPGSDIAVYLYGDVTEDQFTTNAVDGITDTDNYEDGYTSGRADIAVLMYQLAIDKYESIDKAPGYVRLLADAVIEIATRCIYPRMVPIILDSGCETISTTSPLGVIYLGDKMKVTDESSSDPSWSDFDPKSNMNLTCDDADINLAVLYEAIIAGYKLDELYPSLHQRCRRVSVVYRWMWDTLTAQPKMKSARK